jgi:Leucine-rich repeat (LRR) protein
VLIPSLACTLEYSLYANRISELPDEIGDLPALESLLLSNNRLTSLPSSIYRLTSLQDLAIDHNRLTSLPPGLPPAALASEAAETAGATALTGWASLNTLDASYNRLRTLPDGFGTRTLPSLQSLFLSGNRLRWLPVGVLFTFIPGLELFELRHNPVVQGQPYDDDNDDDDENTEGGAQQAVVEGNEDGVIDPEVVDDDFRSDESVAEGVRYAVPALVDLCCCVVATNERLLLSAGASESDQGLSHLQVFPFPTSHCIWHCRQLSQTSSISTLRVMNAISSLSMRGLGCARLPNNRRRVLGDSSDLTQLWLIKCCGCCGLSV